MVLLEKAEQVPEPAVQDGIAAGEVEVGKAVRLMAHVETVFKNSFNLGPRHFLQPDVVVFRENVAVLTALVTTVGDMPLKSKVFHDSVNK
mgnify:CR=1 FL=1